jgi:hypothetical protein
VSHRRKWGGVSEVSGWVFVWVFCVVSGARGDPLACDYFRGYIASNQGMGDESPLRTEGPQGIVAVPQNGVLARPPDWKNRVNGNGVRDEGLSIVEGAGPRGDRSCC